MKIVLVLAVFVATTVSGQQIDDVRSALKKIRTEKDAKDYLARRGAPVGQVVKFNAAVDTTESDQELMALPPGEVIDFDGEDGAHYFYKCLVWDSIRSFRVQYIFLDHAKITLSQVDSLRKLILGHIQSGVAFETLAATYSMDGNKKNGGDLGWFQEGMMVNIFERSVQAHQLGEVYSVDIPERKWYYIVKNTHLPRVDKKTTLLYLKVMP